MKCNLITVLLVFSFISSYSQKTLKGKIDHTSKSALLQTFVGILDDNKVLLKVTIPDTTGYFTALVRQEQSPRYLTITTSTISRIFRILDSTLQTNTPIIDLGHFSVTDQQTYTLKEVNIAANKPFVEFKTDRTTYNIENSVAAVSGSSLDVLKSLPGLEVNNRSITIIGRGTVNVLYNGRLLKLSGIDLINFVQSLPANNIAAIEIIPNPPAKYDAAGQAGLINIRTRKNIQDGFNGTINAGYSQAYYASWDAGINLQFKKKAVNIYTNTNFLSSLTQPTQTLKYNLPFQRWDNQKQVRLQERPFTQIAGIDINLGKRHALSLNYIGNFRSNTENGVESNIILNKRLAITDSLMATNTQSSEKERTHDLNLNYAIQLDSLGKKITISLDYLRNQKDFNSVLAAYAGRLDEQKPGLRQQLLYDQLQQLQAKTAQLDAELPFRWISLSAGGKLSFVNVDNSLTTTFTSFPDNQSGTSKQQFRYEEHISAAYLNANKAFGKVEIQAGIRAEFTHAKGTSVPDTLSIRRRYYNLFPTVFILYRHDANHVFNLSFGKRIERPSYTQFNPFNIYANPNVSYQGNPYLQPQITYMLQASYVIRNMWTIGANYLITDNVINTIPALSADTINIVYSQQGIGTMIDQGIFTSVRLRIGKRIESTNTIVLSNRFYHTDLLKDASSFKLNAGLSTNNTFYLNDNRTLLFNLVFSTGLPGSRQNIFIAEGAYRLDAAIRKTFLNNRGVIALSANNILKKRTPLFNAYLNGFNYSTHPYYDDRNIKLSFNYKFGNQQLKSSKTYKQSNNEEKGRLIKR